VAQRGALQPDVSAGGSRARARTGTRAAQQGSPPPRLPGSPPPSAAAGARVLTLPPPTRPLPRARGDSPNAQSAPARLILLAYGLLLLVTSSLYIANTASQLTAARVLASRSGITNLKSLPGRAVGVYQTTLVPKLEAEFSIFPTKLPWCAPF
jgi:hypothetical protein